MPGPGHGDGILAGNQRLDVVSNQTARELDGVLVVIPGALRSVTGLRVAIVDVVGGDELVESLGCPSL